MPCVQPLVRTAALAGQPRASELPTHTVAFAEATWSDVVSAVPPVGAINARVRKASTPIGLVLPDLTVAGSPTARLLKLGYSHWWLGQH